MHENEIGSRIVDCAVRLHMELGPGLMESVYEITLANRLRNLGLSVDRQVSIPIEFDEHKFHEGFRADLIVGGKVIVEIKSLDALHPVHRKQVLTYLRLTGIKLGYLLNFGEYLLKDGMVRLINGDL
ncbi:MAG: GxxExxY protein [Pirellulales bacterium]